MSPDPSATIRPLPDSTIGWMVAGEVIDSLAAAVRELIDNALDASATHIRLELWLNQWQLRLTDNGSGIPLSDLPQAALAYTTSKLHAGTPPLTVTTLGFRGQALHSLAQMGQLEIGSCVTGDPHGWQAQYDRHGSVQTLRPITLARGTVVSVKDLFAEWPSRRTALEDRRSELKRIINTMQEAALTHPWVTWTLTVDDKPHLTLWPGETPADLLPQILPRLQRQDLRQGEGHGWQVVLGLPDRCHRPRPDWIRVAVNGRFVLLPPVVRGIQSCLQRMVPKQRFPICLAFLAADPEQVDWNRHPAKAEVYLQTLEPHLAHLQAVILETLQSLSAAPTQRFQQFLRASEAKQTYFISLILHRIRIRFRDLSSSWGKCKRLIY